MGYNLQLPDGDPNNKKDNNSKPKLVNAKYVNPFTGQLRTERMKIGTNLPTVNFSEQMRLLGYSNPYLTLNDTHALFADVQPTGERIQRSLGNFGKEFKAGFINSVGASFDFLSGLQAVGLVSGVIDNAFFRKADAILDSKKEVYEQNPGSVNMGDPAWWFNKFSETGNVVGLAAESALESLLITTLTEGIGAPAQILNLAKKAKNLKSAFNILSKSKQIKQFATRMAIFKRYSESVLEAKDSQKQIIDKLIGQGIDKDAAIAIGSKGAAKTFWLNMPLVTLDVVSIQTMFVNPVSGATEEIIDKLLAKVPTTIGKRLAKTGIIAGSEGTEEFIQGFIQNESLYTSELATGLVDETTFKQRTKENFRNADNWNAFWSGAFGGVLLSGGGSAFRKAMDIKKNKYFDNQYSTYLNNLSGQRIKLVDDIRLAEEKGNYELAQNKRRQLNITTALSALHLDHTSNREGVAFEANKTMLNDLLEGVTNKDEKILNELKIDSENKQKLVQQEIKKYLEDVDLLEEVYNNNKEYVDRNSLETATYYGFVKELLKEDITNKENRYKENLAVLAETNLDIINELDEYIDDVSRIALINMYEKKLTTIHNTLNKKTNTSKLTPLEQKQYDKIKDKLSNDYFNISETITNLKKKNQSKTKSDISAETNQIIQENIDIVTKLSEDKILLLNLEKDYDNTVKGYNKWIDPAHQAKITQKIVDGIKRNKERNKKRNKLEPKAQSVTEPTVETINENGANVVAENTNANLDDSNNTNIEENQKKEQEELTLTEEFQENFNNFENHGEPITEEEKENAETIIELSLDNENTQTVKDETIDKTVADEEKTIVSYNNNIKDDDLSNDNNKSENNETQQEDLIKEKEKIEKEIEDLLKNNNLNKDTQTVDDIDVDDIVLTKEDQEFFDYFENGKLYNTEEIFSYLLSKVTNPYLKLFLTKIKRKALKLNVKIGFEDDNNRVPKKAIGVYSTYKNEIWLTKKGILSSFISHSKQKNSSRKDSITSLTNYSISVFLHELIHSFTSAIFTVRHEELKKHNIANLFLKDLNSKERNAVDRIYEIYDYLKKQDILEGEYGITNIHELFAEFANETFVKKLKTIPGLKGDRYSNENIFEVLLSYLAELFGFTKIDDNITKELFGILSTLLESDINTLTKDYTNSMDMLAEQMKQYRNPEAKDNLMIDNDKLLDLQNKLSKINEQLNKLSKSKVEQKVEEILNNKKDFVGLTENGKQVSLNSGENFKWYYNTVTQIKYKRTSHVIHDSEPDKNNINVSTALTFGNIIDGFVRDFFSDNLKPLDKYKIANKKILKEFVEQLETLKEQFNKNGEIVVPNDVLIYDNDSKTAGTIDLLTYTKDGVFRIYDMKTMKGNHFTEYYRNADVTKVLQKFDNKNKIQNWSEQLSIYRIGLHNTNKVTPTELFIIPIELNYNKGELNTSVINILPLHKSEILNKIEETLPPKLEETDEFDKNVIDDNITPENKNEWNSIFDDNVFNPKIFKDNISNNVRKLKAIELAKMINVLENELNKEITFEDFLNALKEHIPREKVKQQINFIILAWEDNNYTKADYDKIYNKLFNPIINLFDNFSNIKETEENKTTIEEPLIEENNEENNKEKDIYVADKTYDKSGAKSVTTALKGFYHFIGKDKKMVIATDINPKKCVDYDYMVKGKIFTVSPAENYNSVKVPVYTEVNGKIETKWVKFSELGFKEGTQNYNDNIPLILKDTVTGEQIMFVTPVGWYNKNNVGKELDSVAQEILIKEAQNNTRLLRNSILNSLNKEEVFKVEITDIYGSSIETDMKNLKPLIEQNPEAEITGVTGNGEILFNNKKYFLNLKAKNTNFNKQNKDTIDKKRIGAFTVFHTDKIIFRHNGIHEGSNADIRFTGYEYVNDVKYKIYTLYNLSTPYKKIDNVNVPFLADEKLIIGIKQAIIAFGSNNPENKKIVETIRKKLGNNYNLNTSLGLLNYIKNFTYIEFDNYKDKSVNQAIQLSIDKVKNKFNSDIKNGKTIPFIRITNNRLVLGVIDKEIENIIIINPNSEEDIKNKKLELNSFFATYGHLLRITTNTKGLVEHYNTKIPLISNNLTLSEDRTLKEILNNNFQSTVISYNINTKQNPKYITRVQPIIEFKPINQSQIVKKEKKKEEIKIVKDEIVKVEKQENSGIADITKSLLEEETNTIVNAITNKKEINGFNFNPSVLNPNNEFYLSKNNSIVKGINLTQVREITNYIYNQLLIKFDELNDNHIISKEILEKNIQSQFGSFFSSKIEKKQNLIKNIDTALELDRDKLTKENIAKLELLQSNARHIIAQYELINENWDTFLNLSLEEVYKRTNIIKGKLDNSTVTEEIEDSIGGQIDEDDIQTTEEEIEGYSKSLSKSSLEENAKEKLPYKLRRFFSAIEQKTQNGDSILNSYELPLYYDFDFIYDKLMEILVGDEDILPSFDIMMDKLLNVSENIPWVSEIVNRMKNADSLTKTQFVINFAKHFISMKSPMVQEQNNEIGLIMYDTNSTEVKRRIITNWDNNFKLSELFKYNNGKFFFDKEKGLEIINKIMSLTQDEAANKPTVIDESIKQLYNKLSTGESISFPIKNINQKSKTDLDDYLQRQSKNTVSDFNKFTLNSKGQVDNLSFYKNGDNIIVTRHIPINYNKKSIILKVKELLQELGINMEEKTIEHLAKRGINYYYNGTVNRYRLNELMNLSGKVNPLGKVFQDIIELYHKKDNVILPEDMPSVAKTMSTYGKNLAKIESIYSNHLGSMVVNVNKKNVYLINTPTYISEKSNKLIKDEEYRNQLLSSPILSENRILLNLNNSDKYRNYFKLHDLSLEAIKKLGTKSFGDLSISSISDKDKELLNLLLIQDTKTPRFDDNYKGLSTRITRSLFPTMSDKGRQFILDLIGFDLNVGDANWESQSITSLNDNLLNVLFDELALPEIRRIAERLKHGPYGIKGYDEGSLLFLGISKFNTVLVNNKNVQQSLKDNDIDEVIKKFKPEFKTILNDLFILKINKKINKWIDYEFIDKDFNKLTYFDKHYKLNKKQFYRQNYNKDLDNKQLAYIAALDSVVNYTLNINNINSLYSGDLAYYVKKIKSDKINIYDETEQTYYDNINEQLRDNISKRLALLIAPGMKSENAHETKHLRVFMADGIKTTDTLDYIASLHYDKKTAEEIKKLLDIIRKEENLLTQMYNGTSVNTSSKNIETSKENIKNNYEKLKTYDKIKDFINVEYTDAQEYQTSRSALLSLKRNGKISQETFEILEKKIEKQKKAERENQKLTQDMLLSDEELDMIFQVEKPVFTGTQFDSVTKLDRIMYLKSSVVTLLPQGTKGKQIDILRKSLEKLEFSNGNIPVKASYQTANKVGSIKNPINIYNPNGTIKDLSIEELKASSIILDNYNDRIQQEAPYKAGKNKPNLVSLGTQMLKLLMGNNVANLNFEYNGELINGKKLTKIYNDLFIDLINNHKNELYEDLGIDATGEKNPKTFSKRIIELILKEAKSRGMQEKDILALEAKIITLENGDEITKFLIPLWLLNDSNKYESLLISLVRNSITKLKMPGYAFAATTSAGWETKLDSTISDTVLDEMIYTEYYDHSKGLTDAYTKEGKLSKVQVFVPSRFKNNNNELIDIFNDKDHQGKPKYWEIDSTNGKKVLKQNMIDKELLSLISFRIPTSSHKLTTSITIAGFIPEKMGDIIVVPVSLLTQKGLDFDFDKETTYQFWSKFDEETGKITKIKPIKNLNLQRKKLSKEEQRLHLFTKLIKKDFINSKNYLRDLKKDLAEKDTDDYKYRHAKFNYFNTKDFNKLNYKQKVEEIKSLRSLLKSLRTELNKTIENELINIHHVVLGSPDSKMQKKITQSLSLEYEKNQSIDISKITNEAGNYVLGFFDDDYQNDAMNRGSSGKMGIGVYSVYMTFNSTIQQLNKPLNSSTNELPIFDGMSFGGDYREISTLDGDRSKADVFDSRAQTAVDDMKENILGKVNINKFTIGVDAYLTLLGFDKGKPMSNGETISLSYYFLSQPILKDYVREMKNSDSITSVYVDNKEEYVINKLKEKYAVVGHESNFQFSSQQLVDNLTTPNNVFQLNILNQFLILKERASIVTSMIKQLGISKHYKGSR